MNDSSEVLRLFRAGRVLEAEQASQLVLEEAPDDIEALKVVAIAALRRGDALRAIVKLDRAAKADPGDPLTRFHLARAHELAGNTIAALAWFETALQIDASFCVARLHYGAALRRAGRADEGLLQETRALREAQQAGRWLDEPTTPAGLRRLVQEASQRVRAHRRELLFALLDPLRQRYGADSMRRVETCLAGYLREAPVQGEDPRQRPTFLHFPGLGAKPFVPRSDLPWASGFEAATPGIRAELDALLESDAGRERVFHAAELERSNLRGLDRPPSWNGYYFHRHGEARPENLARCPCTSAALEAAPLSRIPGHGPETLYSVFTPGTHLLPHHGVTNTRLVAHLPLLVPPDCALRVGGEIHAWREGELVVFDDTYEHEAWNRSDRTRVVLIFDVWNPQLGEAERAAVADIVVALGLERQRLQAGPAGGAA